MCTSFRSQTPQESSPASSDFISFGNLEILLKAHLLTSLFPYDGGGVQKDQQMGIKSCSIQYTCVESHGLEHCRWGSCECRNEIFLFFCSRSKTIGVSFPKCLTITAVKGQWPLLIYPHVEDHSLHPQSLYWRYWVKIYLPFYPKNLGCWNFLAFCAFFFF